MISSNVQNDVLVTRHFWWGFNYPDRHYQCTPIDFGGSVVQHGRYFSAGAQFPGPMTTREGERETDKNPWGSLLTGREQSNYPPAG